LTDLIFLFCSTPLNVEDVYIELVRDSREIIDAIGDEEINDIIRILKRDKNPDYLDFLSTLCECKDVAIHEQQTRITRLLLETPGVAEASLYETRFLKGGQVEIRTAPNKEWIPQRKYADA
jgi:hypothetical protein